MAGDGAFLSLKTIVIFTWNRPGISRRSGGFRKLREEMLRRGFLPSSEGSELYLCMPKSFSTYKGARSARPGPLPSRAPFLIDTMDTNPKQTDMTGKKPRTPSYKYSFRLNEEQNIRLKRLLYEAGLEHNRSRFIVRRIFVKVFIVVRRDPSKIQFIARLNDFYFQFQKLGNNYNQIVKVVNSHFSNVAIPHQIAMLE